LALEKHYTSFYEMNNGVSLRFFLLGRGLISRRIRQLLGEDRQMDWEEVASPMEADIVMLASCQEKVGRFIQEYFDARKAQFWFDFSGYSKLQQLSFPLITPILFKQKPKTCNAIFSLPACYASGVSVSLLHLSNKLQACPQFVWAIGTGGRSTLGDSKDIAPGVIRTVSKESTAYHLDEIMILSGMSQEQLDVRFQVGDLNDGILTCFTIQFDLCGGKKLRSNGLFEGWQAHFDFRSECWVERAPPLNPRECFGSAICKVSVDRLFPEQGKIEGHSVIHNLDFPILIMFAYLRSVYHSQPREIDQSKVQNHY